MLLFYILILLCFMSAIKCLLKEKRIKKFIKESYDKELENLCYKLYSK